MKYDPLRGSPKEMLANLSTATDRRKVSLYLSNKLYKDFKRNCGNASASRMMEELMEQFNEQVNK